MTARAEAVPFQDRLMSQFLDRFTIKDGRHFVSADYSAGC